MNFNTAERNTTIETNKQNSLQIIFKSLEESLSFILHTKTLCNGGMELLA